MKFERGYTMRGWRCAVVVGFGLVFIAASTAFWYVSRREQDRWPLIGGFAFAIFGTIAAVYGMYAWMKGLAYSVVVEGRTLKWLRSDVDRELGRLDLSSLIEVVYIKSEGESPDELYGLDRCGARHKIPIEYMDFGGPRALLLFLRDQFPEIKLSEESK